MRKFLLGLALFALAGGAQALPGAPLVFTVQTDSNTPPPAGDARDFHVSTGSVLVSGGAQRNDGFVEFNLQGQSISTSPVYLSFSVLQKYSPFLSPHSGPQIQAFSYVGDNNATLFDDFAAHTSELGVFQASNYGETGSFTFDVTTQYNNAIRSGDAALGFGFRAYPYYSLSDYESLLGFSLTNTPVVAVPEPNVAWFLLAGLPLLISRRLRSSRR